MKIKQLEALQQLTSKVATSNCMIRPSFIQLLEMEMLGDKLFVAFKALDENETFCTFIIALIGPRGGVKIEHREFRIQP